MTEQNNKKHSCALDRRISYYPRVKHAPAIESYMSIVGVSESQAVDLLVAEGLKHLPPDVLERMNKEKQGSA